MSLDNILRGWFSALRPPYIGSGAAVRAMVVRTPRSDAARPRLSVFVCVCMHVYVGELVEEERTSD